MYFVPMGCSAMSFLVSALFGRLIGDRGCCIYSIVNILCCFLSSCYIFYEVSICQSVCYIKGFSFLSIDLIDVHWGFLFDALSASMLVVITAVSLCAHIYSVEYMRTDPHSVRFFSYLSLFTFCMILLVVSDNAVQLFIGWEGVGICSYLLINFWSTRVQANKSSILAVITNKFGDIALLVSCTALYSMFKTVDFAMLNSCAGYLPIMSSNIPVTAYLYMIYSDNTNIHLLAFLGTVDRHLILDQLTMCCFFLLIAAIGKSAQAGLHVWLPEAMEGPTPVSSLIHAATMVTAGIFLLVRCSYLFFDMSTLLVYLVFFGSITAFFSSTIGLLQTDIKKVVAYSTCSQLGYMLICCGFTAYGNGMYHLLNHAFFKALLFLTAGYVIHAVGNEQDIRKMGSLLTILPFSYIMMLIGSLSLVGFPFFSGFYSKDRIVELCYNHYEHCFSMFDTYKYIIFSQILCILAVIFTLVYSIKMLFFVFLNSYCGFKHILRNIHFSSFFIQVPLLFLSVLSMVSGYVTSDMMVGVGSSFWLNSFYVDTFFFFSGNALQDVYKASFLLHTEYNNYIRQITVLWTIYFIFVSFVLVSHFRFFFFFSFIGSLVWFRSLYAMVSKKYIFINRLLIVKLVSSSFKFSYSVVYRLFDKGVIELIGPFGIVSSTQGIMYSQYKLQSGLVYHYAGFLLLTLIFGIHFFFDSLYVQSI